MIAFDPHATWLFARKGKDIAARPIAYRDLPKRRVVILRDTAEALWVAEWTPTGAKVTGGPVKLAEALSAAEGVVFGFPDHASVAALVNTLALGLLVFNAANQQPGILDPAQYPVDPEAPEVRAC